MFRFGYKSLLVIIFLLAGTAPLAAYYLPPDNQPPGSPPNYNPIDPEMFMGVPALAQLPAEELDGYFVYFDSSEARWSMLRVIPFGTVTYEQFHGSMLVQLDQEPQPGVNFWPEGFDLSSDLHRNDRWGWVKWPEAIAPNLYEIWWDFTVDCPEPSVSLTRTIGFWKNHSGLSPQDNLVSQYLPLWLGDPDGPKSLYVADSQVAFDVLSMALAIEELDGISKLRAQLLATKLDIASGTDGSVVAEYIVLADAFLADHDPSDWDGLDAETQQLVLYWKDMFDAYNNGYIGPGHDDEGSIVVDCDASGCPPCVVGISFSGCAYDFNLWGSSYNQTFSADIIYLGADRTPLSQVPGYSDTFEGLNDPYGHPFECVSLPDAIFQKSSVLVECLEPNLSVFAPVDYPGAAYNVGGMIPAGDEYGDTYGGSRVYEGNGLQFSVNNCGENNPPVFNPPVGTLKPVVLCLDGTIYDTIVVNDFDPGAYVTLTKISGPGDLVSTPGNPPVYGYYSWTPTESGMYSVIFEATDNFGASVVDSIVYDLTVNQPPVLMVEDTTITNCYGLDQVCHMIPVTDPENNVLTFTLLAGNGSLDPETGELCFTPDGDGAYSFEVEVSDLCGADTATFTITVNTNHSPYINPYDTVISLCGTDSICFDVTAFDPDPGDSLQINFITGPGIFTQTGNGVGLQCFLPDQVDSARYVFVYNVTDNCWRETAKFAASPPVPTDSIVIIVITDQPPVISCPEGVQEVYLCGSDTACIEIAVEPADADVRVLEPGAVYEDGKLCVYARESGLYNFTLVADGECGSDTCQVTLDVQYDTAPHVYCPPSGTMHICGPDSISVPLAFAPSNATLTITPEATYSGGMLTFFAKEPGRYCFEVSAENGCGTDVCSFCITVEFDSPPQVTIADTTVFLCSLEEICIPYSFSDPDGNVVNVTVSGLKNYLSPDETEGVVCYTPLIMGINEFTITVTDACGLSDTDTATVIVIPNRPPVASLTNTTFRLCEPGPICMPLSALDPDGVIDSVVAMYPGYYNPETHEICMDVQSTGLYQITAFVYDNCGAMTVATAVARAIINYTPVLTVPGDTSVFRCDLSEICLSGFSVSDRNGNLANIEFFPNIGNYENGTYCFTPEGEGEYCFIVRATDSCGAYDEDTVCVNLSLGDDVNIACPSDIIYRELCGPDSICVDIPITPATADIFVIGESAVYDDGKLCFYAGQSGVYEFTLIAAGDCGSDTCRVTIDVTVDQIPQITCPPSDSIHLCGPGMISLPLGFTPAGAELTITPAVDYSDGMIHFYVEEPGEYCFSAMAKNDCGADTCSFCITVTFDQTPQLTVTDSSVTLCEVQEICLPVEYSDPDGNISSAVVSPVPMFELRDGQVCFTPKTGGTYEYSLTITDSCGASVTDTGTVTVALNEAPIVSIADSAVFLCEPGEVCLPVVISDPEERLGEVIVSEPAYLNAENGTVCLNVTESGTYIIVVTAYDDCGFAAADTATITLELGQIPVLTCPESQNIHLCEPDTIMLPLGVTPAGSAITINPEAVIEDGLIKFLPGQPGEYCFEIIAENDCGADTCNFCITVTYNSPPVVMASDSSLWGLCELQEICVPVDYSDPDNNIAEVIVEPKEFSFVDGTICFLPQTEGYYTYIVTVIDSCGNSASDTGLVLALLVGPPAFYVNSASFFLCEPTEVCLNMIFPDSPGSVDSFVVSEPAYYKDGLICLMPEESGDYEIIVTGYNSCGESLTDTAVAHVTINTGPAITLPDDTTMSFCEPEQVCFPFEASDPDNNLANISVLTEGFEIVGDNICFYADVISHNEVIVTATDSCGAGKTDTFIVNVRINKPPVVIATDTTVFSCEPTVVCVSASFGDQDGSVDSLIVTSPAYFNYDDGTLCLPVEESGVYEIILTAYDDCGASASITVTYDVTINTPPIVNAGADTTVFACTPGEVCLRDIVIEDIDQNISSVEITPDLGNMSDGGYCFTPQEEGEYCFVVRVTDECGAWDEDTVCVTYQLGSDVAISCPEGIQPVNLCSPDSVCLVIPVEPAGAEVVVVEPGAIYENGKLCFFAEGEGRYTYTLIATGDCGVDTCQAIFDVSLTAGPQVTCPVDTALHICDPDSISVPIGVIGSATDIIVTPEASYADGMVTFYADAEGEYCFQVVASNECGADTCNFCLTVTIDSPPVVTFTDTSFYLCNLEEVCLPYEYSDPDNNVVSVTVVSKEFIVTDGLVCFTPYSAGTKEIILAVADSCGHVTLDTAMVEIILNEKPEIFAGDTSVFLCEPADLCVPVTASDPDGVIDSIVAVAPAYYDAETGKLCLHVTESGKYSVVVKAYDDCGAMKADTGTIIVRYNFAPMVTAPADTTVLLCQPEEVCIDGFSVIDIDQNLESIEFIPDIGTYDNGRYCFTPQEPGEYCLIMTATDTCGAVDADTVCITVAWGEYLALSCPEGIQSVSICNPDTVCIDVPVEPADVSVTILEAGGFYKDGQLCFFADHSGQYSYTVVATGDCNADTCVVTVDLSLGELPVITCPEPEPVHLCGPDSISVPLTVTPASEMIITPQASYADGMLTFYADHAGEYCFDIVAVGQCGYDTCNFCITVTFDAPPVVVMNDTTVTMCYSDEVCLPVAYSDPDNNIATVEVYPPGYELVDGAICFSPPEGAPYQFIVTVTDSCGNQTADTATVDVIFNREPSVTVTDSSIALCSVGDICLPVTMSDPDGTIDSVRVTAPAYYDADNHRVCLAVTTSGTYNLIVTVYDDCGTPATDTGTAIVTINTGPTVEFGQFPSSMASCNLSEVCLPIVVQDAEANVVTLSGQTTCGGQITFSENKDFICWLPNTYGTCTITVIVTDACGLSDTAQAAVELVESPNPHPLCLPDTTVFVCTPGQVCIDLGTVNPGSHITVRPDFYSFNPANGELCYYATVDRTDKITVIDSTICGVDSCQFTLTTKINRPPVIAGEAPDEVEFCHSTTLCISYTISDPDNNIANVRVEGTCPGAVLDAANRRVCLDITTDLNCAISLIVQDVCGLADTLILPIVAIANQPPSISLPDIETVVRCEDDISTIVIPEFCVSDPDYDEVILVKDSGLGEFSFDAVYDCGTLSFVPPNNDSATYCFRFRATDECDTVYKTYCLNVLPALVCSTCVEVSIEDPGCVNSGQVTAINIVADATNDIAAYDLLIAYDASAISFMRADIGSAISGWEYFTYRYGDVGNCESPCPSGLIRLVAIADINNGAAHPPADQLHPSGRIASITFRVSSDLNLGGQSIPINFFWMDCGDNGFSDPSGQHLYVDHIIYSPEGNIIWDEFNDAAYPEANRPPHIGVPDECLEGDKYEPIRCLSLRNGELCITHPDSVDARGDMNLNGVPYEIADAVVYTNYFISGLSAFNISIPGQIAASDVNADGLTLSIADLVYLVRVIIGDAEPYPKKIVGDNTVFGVCTQSGEEATVTLNSTCDIGAALLVFNCEGGIPGEPVLAEGITDMAIKCGWADGSLRVLVYSFEAGASITAGERDLIRIPAPDGGKIELVEMELADYYGRVLTAQIGNLALPQDLELTQNHPNPFNPSTSFDLALPSASDYTVTIYNVTGQVVRRWVGYAEAGYVSFEWNGCDEKGEAVASGVYFYRAQAGSHEAIKKMILLK